jgi:PKD repeat protein
MNKLLQLILCLTLLFPAYSRACALDYQPIAIISELAEGNKCRNATFSFDGHWSYDPDDIPDGHNPSQHPGAGIVSYSWTFGDGSTGSGATTSHTYTAAGTYAIRLTVRDNEGNTTWTETWVYVYEVAAVLANGVITTGETFYAALPHLDEPSSRVETYICDVWALANPGNYWFPSCFYWSPGGGGLPRIYPDDCWGAGFYAKDHGTVTITATCGNSTKSMQIAIEGIDLETTVPAAEEISKAYNIFVNENYDQGLEEADLPGHAGCLKKDCSDLTLSGDSSDEIGEISLNLQLYGDNQAQVKLNYDTDSLHIFKNDSLVQSGTWYPANTLEGQLQVEGAYAGSATVMATLKTQDGQQTSDIIWIKTVQLNLTAVWPAPLNDGHEICHRDKMIIQVNNNDSDLDGLADNDPADTLIDLPGGDPDMATITLSVAPLLSASDIDGSVLLTIPSNLKAWKNKNKSGGTAAAEYNLSELPVTLYLEGLQPGGDILDTLIKAEMTLNSGVKCRD